MSAESEFFLASPPEVVRLDTLEISHPNFTQTYRIVRNAPQGIQVTHEGDPIVEWIFDGNDDVVEIGNVLAFERTDEFSVTAWVRTTGGAAIAKQANVGSAGWRMAAANGGGSAGFGFALVNPSADSVFVDCAVDYSDGLDHFQAATYDGSSLAAGVVLYADGATQTGNVVQDDLVSGSIVTSTPLQLGKRGSSNSRTGLLKQVAVWNRVLTESELDEVYGGGVPPDLDSVSCASALVGWWKLDDTDVTGADGITDHGPSGFDGTANFDPTITTEAEFDYEYYPARVLPIASSDDLVQSLAITLGDVGDVIAAENEAVWEANGMDTRPTLTYRAFRSDDLSAPIAGSERTLEIVSVTTTRDGCSFEARAPEYNASSTGERYDLERFPMLRGFF